MPNDQKDGNLAERNEVKPHLAFLTAQFAAFYAASVATFENPTKGFSFIIYMCTSRFLLPKQRHQRCMWSPCCLLLPLTIPGCHLTGLNAYGQYKKQ